MSHATLSDNEIAAIVDDPHFLLGDEDSFDSHSDGDNDRYSGPDVILNWTRRQTTQLLSPQISQKVFYSEIK